MKKRQKARDGTYTEVTSSRPVSPSLLNSRQTVRRTGHTHETTGRYTQSTAEKVCEEKQKGGNKGSKEEMEQGRKEERKS